MATPVGNIWKLAIDGMARSAQAGNPGAIQALGKLASSQDASGGLNNYANDYLHSLGITDIPYADPNRKQKGALGQALRGAAPIWGGAIVGAGALGALGGGGAAAGAGVPTATGGLGGAAAAAPAVAGKSVLGKIGGWISANPGKAAQLGLAGLGMIQGAGQQGKSDQINQQLLSQLQGDEVGRQKLRQLALGRLTQMQGASGNPFNAQYGPVR